MDPMRSLYLPLVASIELLLLTQAEGHLLRLTVKLMPAHAVHSDVMG